MSSKYKIELTKEPREKNQTILNSKTAPKVVKKRANILLQSDASIGKPKTQAEIAARCGVSNVTVYNTLRDYCMHGLEYTLTFKRTKATNPPIVTGDIEARIIALACGEAPDGSARWTLRLLTEKIISLGIIDEISRETVRTTLKKHNLSLTEKSNGVFRQNKAASL